MGVLEAAEDEAEVVEPVRQRRPGDGDAQPGHVGEVRQAHPARLVDLAENHLALRAVQRAPLADAPLQRPADPAPEVRMLAQELLENGDRPQAGARLQHRHDIGVEHVGKRLGPTPLPWRALLRRWPRIMRHAISRGGAEPGASGGQRRGVGHAMLHEERHLMIGHMAAGHGALLRNRETTRIPPPAAIAPARPTRWAFGLAAAGGGRAVGLRPPFAPPPTPLSHPDCRARRILIVAPQLARFKTRTSSFRAASAPGKWPQVRTAGRSLALRASMEFVG